MEFIDQKDDDEFCYGEKTINFKDTCIHTTSTQPFIDDGSRYCMLKETASPAFSSFYEKCVYTDRWIECPDFKPVRAAFREMGIHYPKRHNVRRVK